MIYRGELVKMNGIENRNRLEASVTTMEKKRTYRHWTTLEDRKLLELRLSGMKFREIAQELSRTAISVEKRYRKITVAQDYL